MALAIDDCRRTPRPGLAVIPDRGTDPYVLVACCRPAGFSYEDENPR
jgi:hypothetical protein